MTIDLAAERLRRRPPQPITPMQGLTKGLESCNELLSLTDDALLVGSDEVKVHAVRITRVILALSEYHRTAEEAMQR